MTNPYVRYYLDQQGHGMPVFRGSPWQLGHGQMGYGLGGLFRSIARAVMPMVKSGAKALGNIALKRGANVVGDVLAGKNVKEAAKARALEVASVAKKKAVNKLMNQTGSGKCGWKQTTKKPAKKRKAFTSTARSKQTKKRRTTSVSKDIFG